MTPTLAIGPANYAGQAHTWTQAVSRHLGVPAWSFNRGPVRRGEFRFETDREIPAPVFFAPLLRKRRMRGFLSEATHVGIDGYQTFFQVPQRRDLAADARFLDEAGLQVALIAHGTDIRDPEQHMERNRWSWFRAMGADQLRGQVARSRTNLDAARRLGLPTFVSTPDLLHDQPDATWLPICLDPSGWRNDSPLLERAVPRVFHLPSKGAIKGTAHIEPVMHKLADEGLIEYVAPTGGIPHAELPARLADVDIVIDQLLADLYGVAALEAMAAGRVVIGHVGATRERMPEDPPMLDALPDTLEQVVRGLVADREQGRALAARSAEYVSHWHDGRWSANQLAPFLGVDPVPMPDLRH